LALFPWLLATCPAKRELLARIRNQNKSSPNKQLPTLHFSFFFFHSSPLGSWLFLPFGRLPSAGSGHRRASQGIAGHRRASQGIASALALLTLNKEQINKEQRTKNKSTSFKSTDQQINKSTKNKEQINKLQINKSTKNTSTILNF
jgi:hypothetical protein